MAHFERRAITGGEVAAGMGSILVLLGADGDRETRVFFLLRFDDRASQYNLSN